MKLSKHKGVDVEGNHVIRVYHDHDGGRGCDLIATCYKEVYADALILVLDGGTLGLLDGLDGAHVLRQAAVMDAVVKVIVARYADADYAKVAAAIHEAGAQQLYDAHLGPAIDQIAAAAGYP